MNTIKTFVLMLALSAVLLLAGYFAFGGSIVGIIVFPLHRPGA